MFEINNDLGNIKYKNWHNWFHFCASIIFTICIYYSYDHKDVTLSALSAWGIGILWDVMDGFKPWYYHFEYNDGHPSWLNWLRQNFNYSDKFSLQDILVWDLGGCIIGALLLLILT